MLLKRIFKEDGVTVDYIKPLKLTKRQKLTQRFINKGLEDGYLEFTQDKITVKSKPNDIVFKILEKPGYFCCFDNVRVANSMEAQAYIKQNFEGQVSPDTNNPAGYRKDNFYLCELEGDV